MNRFIVISGCSGGGKSILLGELALRGLATAPEPGRRIIAQGGPMPWMTRQVLPDAPSRLP
jgi:predicted ATPase